MGNIQQAVNGALGSVAAIKYAGTRVKQEERANELRQKNFELQQAEVQRHNMATETIASAKQRSVQAHYERMDDNTAKGLAQADEQFMRKHSLDRDRLLLQQMKASGAFSQTSRMSAYGEMRDAQRANRDKIRSKEYGIDDVGQYKPFELGEVKAGQAGGEKGSNAAKLAKSVRGRRY